MNALKHVPVSSNDAAELIHFPAGAFLILLELFESFFYASNQYLLIKMTFTFNILSDLVLKVTHSSYYDNYQSCYL